MEVERKFTQSFDVNDYEILTDTGWNDIKAIHETVEYDVWIVQTDNHILECADNHIVFDANMNEVFVKDLRVGQTIWTEDGLGQVVGLMKTNRCENMYDVELPERTNHRYYTNGILSHNTTIYTVFLLWYAMYHPDKRVMVCGNKLAIAIEIMDRIRLGYEYCPKAIKLGVKTYNKSCIEFENNSIIRCFATGSSGCRGFSANCVTGDTMVVVADDYDNIYYTPIEKVETIQANSSKMSKYNMMDEGAFMDKKKYYYVYRIVNSVNGKEYIGFHSTDDLDDGYMGSGKLIKKAIEKYGIDKFNKEIIQMFDNKEDAEKLERELVNEDYVKRDDNYNISLGGNVCILFGENNGFYGKHHTQEAKQSMSAAKRKFFSENESPLKDKNYTQDDDVQVDGIVYSSRNQAIKELGIGMDKLNRMLIEDGNGFINSERQMKHIEFMKELDEQKKINHQVHLERIHEANQRPERKEKISKALKGRKNTWNSRINSDPEKIRKTAEKHRGMKRSDEAKKNMSNGLKDYYSTHDVSNKGKVWIHNPSTGEKKYVDKSITLPIGWEFGMGRRTK